MARLYLHEAHCPAVLPAVQFQTVNTIFSDFKSVETFATTADNITVEHVRKCYYQICGFRLEQGKAGK